MIIKAAAPALSVVSVTPAWALDASVDHMTANYIDVGQGVAVLLECSCGAALVGAGGQADRRVDGHAQLMTMRR